MVIPVTGKKFALDRLPSYEVYLWGISLLRTATFHFRPDFVHIGSVFTEFALLWFYYVDSFF